MTSLESRPKQTINQGDGLQASQTEPDDMLRANTVSDGGKDARIAIRKARIEAARVSRSKTTTGNGIYI